MATRTTSARCLGVLGKFGPGALPAVYGRRLTAAMAQSKLDEHKLRTRVKQLETGKVVQAGPFGLELVHMTHSIPDAAAVLITTPLGKVLFTGDYRFDQTPVDGRPADISRLSRLGDEGLAAALRRLDERRQARLSRSPSQTSGRGFATCSRAARAASS
jgi:mRNA degradation ribonuclease J1/J2